MGLLDMMQQRPWQQQPQPMGAPAAAPVGGPGPAAPMQPGQGGQMGITQRPKQRFIDRVLMKQQDQKTEEATATVGAGLGAGPGTIFGGAGR